MSTIEPQPTVPKPGRRRFQFSLDELLAWTTIIAVWLALLKWSEEAWPLVAILGIVVLVPHLVRRFSLPVAHFGRRLLACGSIALAALLVWLGWQALIVAERGAVKAMLKDRNAGMDGLPMFSGNYPTITWYRRLMGDDTCGNIYLNASKLSNKEIRRILNAYPEVDFAILDANYREVAHGGHSVPNRTAPFSK